MSLGTVREMMMDSREHREEAREGGAGGSGRMRSRGAQRQEGTMKRKREDPRESLCDLSWKRVGRGWEGGEGGNVQPRTPSGLTARPNCTEQHVAKEKP